MTTDNQRMKELIKELHNAISSDKIINTIEVIECLLRAKEQIKELDGFDKWCEELNDE